MTRGSVVRLSQAMALLSLLAVGCTRRTEGLNGIASDRPDSGGGIGDPDPVGGADGGGGKDAPPVSDPGCPEAFHKCGGVCVSSLDPKTCGRACEPCPGLAGGGATCDGLKCGVMCPAGQQACVDRCVDRNTACEDKCPAGKNPCGGICVEATNVVACGTACVTCPTSANGTTSCDGTKCVLTCKAGFHQCDDECVRSDSPETCGGACSPCVAPAGGAATCTAGICGVTCPAGKKVCAGTCIAEASPCDGRCADPNTHACGSLCVAYTNVNLCGPACLACKAPANAKATCDGTACGFACTAGHVLCGGQCITCNNPPNGTAACSNGKCELKGCNSGHRVCNGSCITDAQPCGGACPAGRLLCGNVCVAGNCCGNGSNCGGNGICTNNNCQECRAPTPTRCPGRCQSVQPCPGNDGTCGGVTGCDGSCSKKAPADFGAACGKCGGGKIGCDGACSVPDPPNLGSACGSAGRIQCNGGCLGPLYRIYIPSTGDHFYTMSQAEHDSVIASGLGRDEGNVGLIYEEPNHPQGTVALFRQFNGEVGDHFYTIDPNETSAGYVREGIAGYVWPGANAALGTVPLHRLFNPALGDHLYSQSATEGTDLGYVLEGVACHVQR